MVREVKWAEAAWNDLEEAADYIARDSAYYAAAFVREVQEAARSLNHFAERGRVVPELNEPSIREIFVRNFRLIYQVKENVAHIVGFIHGARDLDALWDPEKRVPVDQV